MTENNNIRFHFLDVGDGDCTLIEFPSERIGLIDIHTDSKKNPNWKEVIPYIRAVLNGQDIFRFILTHPHQDHLHGLKDLTDAGIKINNLWHTNHNYEPDKENESWEDYKKHWKEYNQWKDKLSFSKENHKNDFLVQDNIEVLSPSKELDKQYEGLGEDNDGVHRNNYVLKITHGNFAALMAGDADDPALNHLIDVDSAKISNCTLLKAPHHGTHFNDDFVFKCNPKIVIFHQGDDLEEHSEEKNYKKEGRVVAITKKHGVIVYDGFKDGTYKFIANGTYKEVLGKL